MFKKARIVASNKALRGVAWKVGIAYLRRRYGRQARAAWAMALIAIAVAGYLAAGSDD